MNKFALDLKGSKTYLFQVENTDGNIFDIRRIWINFNSSKSTSSSPNVSIVDYSQNQLTILEFDHFKSNKLAVKEFVPDLGAEN